MNKKTKEEIEKLKAAREAALGNYSAATDITAAAYDYYHVNSDYWEAYRAARENSKARWDAYVAADKAFEEANKE